MNLEFEKDGTWWLPESPNHKVPGKVKFTPGEGLVLDLHGALQVDDNLGDPNAQRLIEPSLILGHLIDGKDITLEKCLQIHSFSPTSSVQVSSFIANTAYAGVHFSSMEETRFWALYVRYSYLDQWINKKAFSIECPSNTSLIIRYEQPLPAKVNVDDYELSFISWGPSYSGDPWTHANVSQEGTLVISSAEQKPLTGYLDLVRRIQDFLSLAMVKPTFITSLQGVTESNKQAINGEVLHLPVDIYFAYPWLPVKTRAPHPIEMLFTLPDIEEHLGSYINNWLHKADTLTPVFNLYFATLYEPQVFLEFKFLSLAQAIETYHRRIIGGKYQTDEEYLAGLYKVLVNAVPHDLDGDFRQSLKEGKLKYANEYSLRRRLHELTIKYSSGIPFSFLSSKTARDRFIDKVCDTRNFLTHYPAELESKSARGEELSVLVDQLKALLEVIFLEEIGLDIKVIRVMVSENKRYRTVIV
jgi:hypothetical protein